MSDSDDAQVRLALAVNQFIDAADALAEAMKAAPECFGQAQATVKSGEDAKTIMTGFRFSGPRVGFRMDKRGNITGFAVREEGEPFAMPRGFVLDLTEQDTE